MNLDYFHLINLIVGIITIIWGIRIAFKCSGKLRSAVFFINGVTLIVLIQILGAISMEFIVKEAKSSKR